MATQNSQVISIFECQTILKLQDLAPEELVDKIFGPSQSFKLSREEFKELFKKNFTHVLKEKNDIVNEALERVFSLSDRDCDNYLDVDEFGKGVGIFTSKRLTTNTTRDFFYYLDKDFRGFINDKDVKEFVTGLASRGIRDVNLSVDTQGLFGTIHRQNQNNRNNDTTYWQFYRYRNLDQIKKLEALFSQINAQPSGVQITSTITTQKPHFDHQSKSTIEQPVSRFGAVPVHQRQTSEIPNTGLNLEKQETVGSMGRAVSNLKNGLGVILIRTFDEYMELAHITGLSSMNAKDLVRLLKAELSDTYSLTQDHFVQMFAEIFKGKYKNFHQFKDQLTSIFNYLDTNGNGVLDVEEIIHGFIHMGAGSERDKIEAAFMIIDKDGSGFVDYQELFYYFKQMFMVSAPNDQGLDAEAFEQEITELASATAGDVFKVVDANGDEKVSLEEFIYWYENEGKNPEAFDAAKKKSSERKKILDKSKSGPKSLYTIQKELSSQNAYTQAVEDLRKILPFEKINIGDAIGVFKKDFDMEIMPLPDFVKLVEVLLKKAGLDISNKSLIKEAATKVFTVIDYNSSGTLDMNELAIGLSLICGGTATEKIRAAFVLHDRDNSNNLDLGELTSYMVTIFRIVGHNNKSKRIQKTNPEELARLTAIQCFEQCGMPLHGSITYDNFRQWFIA